MRVKAMTTFTGQDAMRKGEVREVSDTQSIRILLAHGYIKPVDVPQPAATPQPVAKKKPARKTNEIAKRRKV